MEPILNPEKIKEVENDLLEAIKVSDVETLDSLLHHDLLFITPSGDTVTKAQDLASHKAGSMIVEKIESTIEKINFIGDTAVVTVVYNTKGKMLGTPIEGRFRYIRFRKVINSNLQVIGGSCCRIS